MTPILWTKSLKGPVPIWDRRDGSLVVTRELSATEFQLLVL